MSTDSSTRVQKYMHSRRTSGAGLPLCSQVMYRQQEASQGGEIVIMALMSPVCLRRRSPLIFLHQGPPPSTARYTSRHNLLAQLHLAHRHVWHEKTYKSAASFSPWCRCCPKEFKICQASKTDPTKVCCKTDCVPIPGTEIRVCCPENKWCLDPNDPTQHICCPKGCTVLNPGTPPVCCKSNVCLDINDPTRRVCCDSPCVGYGPNNMEVCCPQELQVLDPVTGVVTGCCPKEQQVTNSAGVVTSCCPRELLYGDSANPKCCLAPNSLCNANDGTTSQVCCAGPCDSATGGCCGSDTTPCPSVAPWSNVVNCCPPQSTCLNGE